MESGSVTKNVPILFELKNDYPGSVLHKIKANPSFDANPIPKQNLVSQPNSTEGKIEVVPISSIVL